MNFATFTPHGFCLAWDPGLIWLQALSDLLIALAYFSIPAALVVFLRRREDLAFRPVFGLFAAFILACGTTHVMSVLTLWVPLYWLDGGIKALTAALSVATAIMLWPLLPKALAIPSPRKLRELNIKLAEQVEERGVAARQLRESEIKLRQLYARTPAILHAADADGVLVEVSDRWLELFGYGREEVIGRKAIDFYAPESQPDVAKHFAELKSGRGALRAERCIRRKSGELRDAEAVFELEYDRAGRLTRFLVALVDISARKEAERALRASEERLHHAQKMEAVGQLTGGIAHDFNNLLTTVMGSLEMLANRGQLDARGQRLTGNALEGARRAARLTSQLLAFSRRARLAPEPLVLETVVAGIRDMLAPTLGENAELVVATAEPGQWPALADRNMLEMALVNLVINARDAIRSKGAIGQVDIGFANRHLTAAQAERLTQDPLVAGDYVSISVRDSGIGMSPAVLARAFEPFFTTKPAGAGTGLGLAQTYGFATQSGGTVQISSTEGVGTIVEILLPRATAGVQAPPAAPPTPTPTPTHTLAASGHGRGETILVAEDDRLLRQTVAEALQDQGYRVISVADGPAALAVLQTNPAVDLLFTDIMMPGGMTGVDLALAARAKLPALNIVFATGYSDRKVLEGWRSRLDLVPKPYTLDEIALRIGAYFVRPTRQSR